MAFAQELSCTEYASSAAEDPSIPFAQETGALCVIIMSTPTPSQTISLPGGWTDETNHNGLSHIFRKILDGSEGGQVLVTLATNQKVSAFAYTFTAFDETTPLHWAGLNVDTTANPNPPSLNPPGGAVDERWIAFAGYTGSNAQTDNDDWATAPTNYTGLRMKSSVGGTGSSNASLMAAHRELNASSEDPGTFTLTVTSGGFWSAGTIAIHHGTGGPSGGGGAPVFRIGSPILQLAREWEQTAPSGLYVPGRRLERQRSRLVVAA